MDETGFERKAHARATVRDYEGAVRILCAAITMFPEERRLWNNRSYCYYKMKHHKKALEDADKMIRKFPKYAKGYYRQGKAYYGLQKYKEAEEAFKKVLLFNNSCEPASKEIVAAKVKQLVKRGHPKVLAQWALKFYNTIEAAEFLMSTDYPHSETRPHPLVDPTNPEGHNLLWIGNLTDDVTIELLRKVFSQYGEIVQLDLQPLKKNFAFLGYNNPQSAGRAMQCMQGASIGKTNIHIKYDFKKGSLVLLLKEKGFSRKKAEWALKFQSTYEGALNFLTSGGKPEEDTGGLINLINPKKYTSLRVENVGPGTAPSVIVSAFSSYGPITSVKVINEEKGVAIVEFTNAAGAGNAMMKMKNKQIGSNNVKIKYNVDSASCK